MSLSLAVEAAACTSRDVEPDDPLVDVLSEVAQKRVAYHVGRLIDERGWPVSKVARRGGITNQTVISVRNAATNPTVKTLALLAHAFEVDVGELLKPTPEDG